MAELYIRGANIRMTFDSKHVWICRAAQGPQLEIHERCLGVHLVNDLNMPNSAPRSRLTADKYGVLQASTLLLAPGSRYQVHWAGLQRGRQYTCPR